ncbi:SusD/RagB family nutrient-binding outer membrane lipoprotein [Nitritalea halalkaliphila]|uniref:SusD/RagB family nutrient-binding outer membrane lipoprotein n=1 Tax=Nitritalea halalkaliphila TaxID=590849 RepID=UPI00059173A0|nr:SusD/RagB family nutrient-binding outer membrane lipoprotein [Nitritalea halalkaliphila]
MKFIEAEAQQRLGNFSAAAEALNAAITASMQRVTGSAQPAYLAVYGATAADMAENGLERIFTEKHIDMFLQTESWVDWRRSIPAGAAPTVSGIPALTAPAGNLTDNAFPRRYLYPPSELDNNAANIPETSLLARVFWDR